MSEDNNPKINPKLPKCDSLGSAGITRGVLDPSAQNPGPQMGGKMNPNPIKNVIQNRIRFQRRFLIDFEPSMRHPYSVIRSLPLLISKDLS